MKKPDLKIILPVIIIIISGFILFQNIKKPLIGHHDWNNVFYGHMARNYLHLGLFKTKLGQTSTTELTPSKLSFYTHYPPLLPLSLALSYKILGVSEFSTRLVPIIFSTGILVLLFKIAKQLKFSNLSALSTSLVAFTPMFRYFGKMADQEAPLIFFTLLSLLYYLKLIKNSSKKNKIIFYLSVILNALTAWAGYFLYPILFLHALIFKPILKKTIFISNLTLVLVFLLHLTHTYILTGSFLGGGLISALLMRLNISHLQGKPDPSGRQFTLIKYLIQQARWLTVYFTRTLLAVGSLSIGFMLPKFKQIKKLSLKNQTILILFFWSLTYPIIFSNVVFIHEYFNFFFLPFLSLSLAWLVQKFQQKDLYLAIFAFIALAVFIYLERLPFYQALEQTKAHQSGYQLGTLINQTVDNNQKSLVIAHNNYLSNHEPFIKFYANQPVKFAIYDSKNWHQIKIDLFDNFDYVFTVTKDQPYLFIDQALATKSAIIKQTNQFNAYQL